MTWIDSFKMAITAIGAHKLRSFLTLVGIIAGVAAIISVMTGVSVIQSQMEAELSVLSTRTFQIMKFPMWPAMRASRMAPIDALRYE